MNTDAIVPAPKPLVPTVYEMVESIPATWRVRRDIPLLPGSVCWEWRSSGSRVVRVIVSVDDCELEGIWLHSSASAQHKGRVVLPTWEELSMVKAAVHEDRLAIQILPPRREYVNLTEALHLWERLDAPTIPAAVVHQVAG